MDGPRPWRSHYHEDIDPRPRPRTGHDHRLQRGPWSRARLLWLLIGPGILVMLGENDVQYAVVCRHRSPLRHRLLSPFVVLTFVMACVFQEMTVRLGAATHRGHAELIFDRFGPFWDGSP